MTSMQKLDDRIDAVVDFTHDWLDPSYILYLNRIRPDYPYELKLKLTLEEAEEFIGFLKGSLDRSEYSMYIDFDGYFHSVKFKGHIQVQTPEVLQLCKLATIG